MTSNALTLPVHATHDATTSKSDSLHTNPQSLGICFTAWLLFQDQFSHYGLLGLPSAQGGDYLSSWYITSGFFSKVMKTLTERRLCTGLRIPSRDPNRDDYWLVQAASHMLTELLDLLPQWTSPPATGATFLSSVTIERIFSLMERLQNHLCSQEWNKRDPYGTPITETIIGTLSLLLEQMARLETLAQDLDKAIITFILVQLLVCAYQLADLTARADDAEMQMCFFKIVEEAAHLALSAALKTRISTWRKNPHSNFEGDRDLASTYMGRDSPTISNTQNMADFIQQYRGHYHSTDIVYCIDTIIVVYHLTELHKLPGASFSFGTVLQRACYDVCPLEPIPSLAAMLAYTRLVHPLTRLNAAGSFESKGFTGWNLLLPAVDAFFTSAFSKFGQQTPNDLHERSRMLYTLLGHCFSFLQDWQWDDADAVLMLLFKFYARNDMMNLVRSSEYGSSRASHEFFTVKFAPLTCGLTPLAYLQISPQHPPPDAHVFLGLVAHVLQHRGWLLQSPNPNIRQVAHNRLLSLVFGLLPNNTRFFITSRKVQTSDYEALSSHYDLCLTLYLFSPSGYQLQPKLVEKLANFPTCPENIRGLIIDVWAKMLRSAATTYGRIEDIASLVSWGCTMLKAIVWDSKDADLSATPTVLAQKRASISRCITKLLGAWTNVMSLLRDSDKTMLYLVDQVFPASALQDLTDYFYLVNKHLTYLEPISQGIGLKSRYAPHINALELLQVALSIPAFGNNGVRSTAEDLARSLVSFVLSTIGQYDGDPCLFYTDTLSALTEAWFKIASLSIGSRRSWDAYLMPPSTLSFQILADTVASLQCTVLFRARIVEHSPVTYILDRYSFYAAWLSALVLPSPWLLFEHVLSHFIHQVDFRKHWLGSVLNRYVSGQGLQLSLFELKQERLEIISLLLAKIHSLQSDPTFQDDSQESFTEALSSSDLAGLLRVLMGAMKESWRNSPDVLKPQYLVFVQTVLAEVQSYQFEGFEVDKWFTDASEPEFPKASGLFSDYFKAVAGAGGRRRVDMPMVRAFRESLWAACTRGVQQEWIKKTVAALSCHIGGDALIFAAGSGQLLVDASLQEQFLRVVFPVYLKMDSESPAMAPLVAAIVAVLVNLQEIAFTRVEEAGDPAEFGETVRSLLRLWTCDEIEEEFRCLELPEEEKKVAEMAREDLIGAIESS